MRYRRSKRKGGTFFFTVVTYGRIKILTKQSNVDLLRASFRHVMQSHPFVIDAFVLLPDHLHCIWTLPDGDRDFSKRWRLIKTRFTRNCDINIGLALCDSRVRKKEKTVWQRRFWEHQIRDARDFEQHLMYIHYNPVRHNYVRMSKDWPFSSFHKYVRLGKYNAKWGLGSEIDLGDRCFGE